MGEVRLSLAGIPAFAERSEDPPMFTLSPLRHFNGLNPDVWMQGLGVLALRFEGVGTFPSLHTRNLKREHV